MIGQLLDRLIVSGCANFIRANGLDEEMEHYVSDPHPRSQCRVMTM